MPDPSAVERTLTTYLRDLAVNPAGDHTAADRALIADPAFAAAIDWLVADVVSEVCDETRMALQSTADHAPESLSPALAAHFANCPDCQAFHAGLALITVDEREAVVLGAEFDDLVNRFFRERIVAFAKQQSAAEVGERELQGVRGSRGDALEARRDVVNDLDQVWTLIRYAVPVKGLRAFRVDFLLCEYGNEQTPWTATPWKLTARRNGERIETRQDRYGRWAIVPEIPETTLDELEIGVTLEAPND
jgi:hypothetical protein